MSGHMDTVAGSAIIEVRAARKAFGAMTAVDDVSLTIKRNEFFALLGPSGCGKTTLLRMLAGFETPDSGSVMLDGQDMTGVPPNRRPVNMVFQSYAVFPYMTVWQNVAYGLRVSGTPSAEIRDRVAAALAMVRLEGFDNRKPDQLSGGQRQRVALARALVKRPKVLLLDEPLSALDRKLRADMQFELKRLQAEVGITFVIVTHDQEEAMGVASRIGVMNAGQIAQIGAPADIYERPASRFVADFVGTINQFEGTVEAVEEGRITVACPELERPVQAAIDGSAPAPSPGSAVWLAVRPERFHIGPAGTLDPTNGTNASHAIVREAAYLGTSVVSHVELPGGRLITVSAPNASAMAAEGLAPGAEIGLTWAPDSTIVLTG